MIVVMREALIKTVIRLVANATAKKILWGDNVPVANQISLDFPIVNSVIVHQLQHAMKKQVRKNKIEVRPLIYYVRAFLGFWDPPHSHHIFWTENMQKMPFTTSPPYQSALTRNPRA